MIKQDGILCQTNKSPLGPFNIKTCGVHPPSQTMDPGSSPGRQKYPVTPGDDPGSTPQNNWDLAHYCPEIFPATQLTS